MDNHLIIENYIDNNIMIKYIENNSYILLQNKILTIFFNDDNLDYFTEIKNKYKGIIKGCCLQKNSILYTYILEIRDVYILEFLSNIYNNTLNKDSNISGLYNDYINFYYNQKNNETIFI